jgi:hypothetical protein
MIEETKLGKNPNSLANLHKWKKGESGNPKGRRPNELCFTAIAKKMLPEVCPYDAKGRSWAEYLTERWLAQSVENPAYFRELIERLEGKVAQPISGEGGGPVKVELDVKPKIISAISRLASASGEGKDDPKPQQ